MPTQYLTFIHNSDNYIEEFSRPFPENYPNRPTFYYFTNSYFTFTSGSDHRGFHHKPHFFYLFVKNPRQDNIKFDVLRCPDFNTTFRYYQQFERDRHWLFKRDKKGHYVADPPILKSFNKITPDLVAQYNSNDNTFTIIKPDGHKGTELPLLDKDGAVPREFIDVKEIVSAVSKIKDSYPFIAPKMENGRYVWEDWA